MNVNKKIVIIGGGPTGLGAAYKLYNTGNQNWRLYEQNSFFGGHSATHSDSEGFLWDEGGHVLFSHYKEYDNFVEKALKGEYYRHERVSWIQYPETSVPYPFQNNIRYLLPEDQLSCLYGLLSARKKTVKLNNFKEWVFKTFGEGIANKFMLPYNFSVWATPPELMSKDWIAERVSIVDYERILANIILKKDDVSWGPNNTFVFPKYGGTGQIYNKGAKLIKGDIRKNHRVKSINVTKKEVVFANGNKDTYDYLLSSVPLDRLLLMIEDVPPEIKKSSDKLVHNSILVIGLGIEKEIKTSKCWVYFPDPQVPFYRLTYFHNYSPYVVPEAKVERYSALMCEVSYSQFKKVDKRRIVSDVIEAIIRYGIIKGEDRKKIISKTMYDIEYGYPIPTIDRDTALKKIQTYLLKNNIYSRGRYGAWKYEISNMDHCFMQGFEAVDSILEGKKETVWTF